MNKFSKKQKSRNNNRLRVEFLSFSNKYNNTKTSIIIRFQITRLNNKKD